MIDSRAYTITYSGGELTFTGDGITRYFNDATKARELVTFMQDISHMCRIISYDSMNLNASISTSYSTHLGTYPLFKVDGAVYMVEEL